MHEKLYRAAVIRGFVWLAAVLWMVPLGATFLLAYFHGWAPALLFNAVAAVALLALALGLPWLFLPLAVPAGAMRSSTPVVEHIAQGLSAARGTKPVDVRLYADPSANVGCFNDGGSEYLVVTSGAVDSLSRDELEAVCGVQLAIGGDRNASTLAAAASGLGSMFLWLAVLAHLVVVLLMISISVIEEFNDDQRSAFLPFLFSIPASIWAAWAVWWGAPHVRWWSEVVADAVSIRTTRNPLPLVAGLQKIARAGGLPVRTRSWLAATGLFDCFYLAPVRNPKSRVANFLSTDVVGISSTGESSVHLQVRAATIKALLEDRRPWSDWTVFTSLLRQATVRLGKNEQVVLFGDVIGGPEESMVRRRWKARSGISTEPVDITPPSN